MGDFVIICILLLKYVGELGFLCDFELATSFSELSPMGGETVTGDFQSFFFESFYVKGCAFDWGLLWVLIVKYLRQLREVYTYLLFRLRA